MIEGFWMRFGH